MRRGVLIAVAPAALVAAGVALFVALGHSSSSPAQPAAEVPAQCPPVTGPRWVFPAAVRISSIRYEAFTVSYDCARAATYIRRLAAVELKDRTSGDESPLGGVPGFSCVGYPDRLGHAYGGSCRRGSVEFGWNWNVLYRATEFTQSGERARTSTSEYLAVLTSLGHGRFRLHLGNTSGIGAIDAFTWTPPPGMTIRTLTSVAGGACRLQPGGSIACTGKLRPPSCLCSGEGGAVTLEFEAASGSGSSRRVSYAPEGQVRITAMTAVPYLVPSTPQEEHNRTGL
jgi:hypothetical protein